MVSKTRSKAGQSKTVWQEPPQNEHVEEVTGDETRLEKIGTFRVTKKVTVFPTVRARLAEFDTLKFKTHRMRFSKKLRMSIETLKKTETSPLRN